MFRIVLFALLAVASTAARPQSATLFDRLGGEPVMTRVIDQMVATMVKDPEVAETLRGIDLRSFSRKLYAHLCATTGGPCTYVGEDLHTVHDGMNITKAELDVAGAALVVALDANGVGEREKQELLRLRAPMRKQIEAGPTPTAQR